MTRKTTLEKPTSRVNTAIVLCCFALLLVGFSSTLIEGIPTAYHFRTQNHDLGQVAGAVTETESSYNVTLVNLGDSEIIIGNLGTNDVEITLRIYCFNYSLDTPVVYEETDLFEAYCWVSVFGDATIEIAREEADALFAFWLNIIERILVIAPTLAVQWGPLNFVIFALGIALLIPSLWLLPRSLQKLKDYTEEKS